VETLGYHIIAEKVTFFENFSLSSNLKNAIDLQQLDCQTRNTYLRMLKQKYNLSIRQIERLMGINRGIVLKA